MVDRDAFNTVELLDQLEAHGAAHPTVAGWEEWYV